MASIFKILSLLLLALLQFECVVHAQTGPSPSTGSPQSPRPTGKYPKSPEPKGNSSSWPPYPKTPKFVPGPSSPDPASPLNDDFYKPPEGLENVTMGTILKHRQVPNPIKLFQSFPGMNPQVAWQILYRTQNSVGVPEANVVTVLVPHAVKTHSLFSLSYFTVSVMPNS